MFIRFGNYSSIFINVNELSHILCKRAEEELSVIVYFKNDNGYQKFTYTDLNEWKNQIDYIQKQIDEHTQIEKKHENL